MFLYQIKKLFLISILILFSASVVSAQQAASASSKAQATEQPSEGEDLVEAPEVEVAPEMEEHSILSLMFNSGFVVQSVLWLLIGLSVITWGIVITKGSNIRTAKRESKEFDSTFWSSKNLSKILEVAKELSASPVANVYMAGHKELTAILATSEQGSEKRVSSEDLEDIDRALKKAKAEELNKLEAGTTFLATTASAAPFIGLFGTVWGIMNAFIGLAHVKSSSIQAVAPGISEALIATAIGLAAAIPAAIFYNVFMQQVRLMSRGIDSFSAEFLNIARRHFLR